jgi:hypothetical protein
MLEWWQWIAGIVEAIASGWIVDWALVGRKVKGHISSEAVLIQASRSHDTGCRCPHCIERGKPRRKPVILPKDVEYTALPLGTGGGIQTPNEAREKAGLHCRREAIAGETVEVAPGWWEERTTYREQFIDGLYRTVVERKRIPGPGQTGPYAWGSGLVQVVQEGYWTGSRRRRRCQSRDGQAH